MYGVDIRINQELDDARESTISAAMPMPETQQNTIKARLMYTVLSRYSGDAHVLVNNVPANIKHDGNFGQMVVGDEITIPINPNEKLWTFEIKRQGFSPLDTLPGKVKVFALQVLFA